MNRSDARTLAEAHVTAMDGAADLAINDELTEEHEAEGAIAVERDGSPMIAIVPVEEYERLVALDRAAAREGW